MIARNSLSSEVSLTQDFESELLTWFLTWTEPSSVSPVGKAAVKRLLPRQCTQLGHPNAECWGQRLKLRLYKNVYPETVQEKIPFSFVFLCMWQGKKGKGLLVPEIEPRASYLNKHQLHHQAVFFTPKYILNAYFRKQNLDFELSVFWECLCGHMCNIKVTFSLTIFSRIHTLTVKLHQPHSKPQPLQSWLSVPGIELHVCLCLSFLAVYP